MDNESTDRPNVVFIISDQHKRNATGCYGDGMAITPNIDELARTGVRLDNCYAPSPLCAPCRAALITGMEPYANGAIYHQAPIAGADGRIERMEAGVLRETGYHEGLKTIGDVFREHGYATAAPGKMHVHGELQKGVAPQYPAGNDLGFDETSVRYYTHFPGGHYEDEVGKDTYQRYRQFEDYDCDHSGAADELNTNYVPTLVKDDEDNFDMVVTRKTIEFLERRAADGKNFFIHVGLEKPHMPFTTAQKYLDMYNPRDFIFPDTVGDWYERGRYPWVQNWVHNGLPAKDPNKARNTMASYYACISEVDDMVGRIVGSLKDNGLYDNTILIYTSDHGEHLFEHGLRGKHNMYEAAVTVPFIISYPTSLPSGANNNSLISLIDVMPTLCDMLGWDAPQTCMGQSFLDVIRNGASVTDRTIFSEFRAGDYAGFPGQTDLPSRMVRRSDHKFVYTHGVVHQLYNLKDDPDELVNLAMDDEHRQTVNDWCFQALADWRFQQYSPMEAAADGSTLTWQPYEHATRYSVYHSADGNPPAATCVASEIAQTSFEMTSAGDYWVMAHPEFTRTCQRFGDQPVYVESHTFVLPITDPFRSPIRS